MGAWAGAAMPQWGFLAACNIVGPVRAHAARKCEAQWISHGTAVVITAEQTGEGRGAACLPAGMKQRQRRCCPSPAYKRPCRCQANSQSQQAVASAAARQERCRAACSSTAPSRLQWMGWGGLAARCSCALPVWMMRGVRWARSASLTASSAATTRCACGGRRGGGVMHPHSFSLCKGEMQSALLPAVLASSWPLRRTHTRTHTDTPTICLTPMHVHTFMHSVYPRIPITLTHPGAAGQGVH